MDLTSLLLRSDQYTGGSAGVIMMPGSNREPEPETCSGMGPRRDHTLLKRLLDKVQLAAVK